MKRIVLFILLICIGSCASGSTDMSIIDVDAKEAYELIYSHKNDLIILDIRTESEYIDGHINGAINIDFYSKDFREKLSKLDREKTYLLYCRTGNRSSKAISDFRELGFKKIYHLYNGISEWYNKGLPVYKN